jgi:putative RecB family exonuclease
MEYPVPTSLSPSRVDAFTTCPLQFRFSSIEKLPEPPGEAATKGSMVHRALELLFCMAPADRTPAAAHACLDLAVAEYLVDPEFLMLGLDPSSQTAFIADAATLIDTYLTMENPTAIREIGLELRLEAPVGQISLRGIIDRLELDHDGGLIVTDYKTGRPPRLNREQGKLGGVNFYSFLCQAVLGQRPSKVRLMYLRTGETIESTPSEQSVTFLTKRTSAVWNAVERACSTGDFRPRPSALCSYCAFQAYCPSFGGDPTLAAAELGAGTIAA